MNSSQPPMNSSEPEGDWRQQSEAALAAGREPPRLPLLLYDGKCSFCGVWLDYGRQLIGNAIAYAPSQEVGGHFPQISAEDFKQAAQFVDEQGHVSSGAHAIFRALSYAPRKRWLLWCYLRLPGFAPVSEALYKWIARHRSGLYRLVKVAWGRRVEPARYERTRRVFLAALGLIYLIAFLSWWVQIPGLIGSNGLLPASDFLAGIHGEYGARAYLFVPSLAWLRPTQGFISGLALAGVAASLLAVANVLPGPALLAAWALYLSQVAIGQTFMAFQWDTLLLEAGFLAVFFAPWRLLPGRAASLRNSPPSPAIVWLYRWLIFRLMFSSGFVKWMGGDSSWRDFTALSYHYLTQPLPTIAGWYLYQMPMWTQKISCAFMFFIELLVPFLVFAPRRYRILAAYFFAALQALIFATGNYTYFNLLTVVLCIPLLDDQWFEEHGLAWPKDRGYAVAPLLPLPAPPVWRRASIAALTMFLLWASFYQTVERYGYEVPGRIDALLLPVTAMHIVGGYGLFQNMTKQRVEIEIQGSNDGESWSAYSFRYKPGELSRAPVWVQPHQPRLDWQMWFAALSTYQSNPWFVNLMIRLLENSPEVLRLMGANPFPSTPPRYVRAVAYDYRFTTLAEKNQTGNWWKREELGLYFPAVSLKEGGSGNP